MSEIVLRSGFKRNPGRMPEEVRGKRVFVQLRNGSAPSKSWPADGRNGCSWSLRGSYPYDVVGYRIDGES